MALVCLPYPGETNVRGLCGQKIYNPGLPFKRNIGNMYPGKMIFVSGIPDPNCDKFTVSLMCGEQIVFRVAPRVDWRGDKDVIVRNSKIDRRWGKEERGLSCPSPFKADRFFEMVILVESSCYKVAVNDQHLFEFNHRMSLEDVDTLHIKGKVRACMVRIQG